jgi:adenine phosphoribosyltransferase
MKAEKSNLEDYIRTVKDFPKEGIDFKDITPLLGNAQAFHYTIDLLAKHYQNKLIDKIGAFDARGFLFGSVLAYKMNLPFFPIRKKGKLPYDVISQKYGLEYGTDEVEIHADAVLKNERVLLVDDVLATGGTMKAGCKLVEQLEGIVSGCAVVIELKELNGREKLNGYNIYSMVKY